MKIRVLAVERHEMIRRGIHQMFRDIGSCELCGIVESTGEALELMAAEESAVNIVLINAQMANLESIGASIGSLVDTGAQVIVYGTTYDPYLVRVATESGAAGVLASLWDVGDLEDIIVAVSQGGPFAERLPAGIATAAALSPRQREVLGLYAAGESAKQVASRTGLSLSTVYDYLDRIRTKYTELDRPIGSRVDFYRRAVEDGFLRGGGHNAHE